VQRTLTLPAQGGVRSVSATCPRRRSIALGGFRATPYDGDGPYVSQLERASRRRWTSAAFRFPGRAAQLVAIAYCA
jgi:hypothetical protein